jgi:hypothetical protein
MCVIIIMMGVDVKPLKVEMRLTFILLPASTTGGGGSSALLIGNPLIPMVGSALEGPF